MASLIRPMRLCQLHLPSHPIRSSLSLQTQTQSLRLAHGRARGYATKTTQDKDSLDPVSTEHSKSGGDHAASHDTGNTAFDPSQTRPEEERASAEAESGESSNPLQVSPANAPLSRGNSSPETQGGSEASKAATEGREERARSSGFGSPTKHGDAKHGGSGGTYN